MRILKHFFVVLFALTLSFDFAQAFPLLLPPSLGSNGGGQIVLASTQSQANSVQRQCQSKYGERFVRLGKRSGRVVCMLRDSNATITKKALKKCAAGGATFKRITNIRTTKNRYIARFLCVRRGQGLRNV
jgi:hypothetical protein